MYLCKVFIFVCVIYNSETKNVRKEAEEHYGLDSVSDDWSQQKWNSIFKPPRPNECSDKLAYGKLDAKSSSNDDGSNGKECRKKFNELQDLSKDQVFTVDDVHKDNEIHKPGNLLTGEIKYSDQIVSKTSNDENNPDFSKNDTSKGSLQITSKPFLKSTMKSSKPDLNSDSPVLENSKSVSTENLSGKENISVQRNIQRNFSVYRSFIFNPNAMPQEKFQNCTTPRNESGFCRYLQHCMIPNIVSSLNTFMGYVCIIEERFIGVCCPHLPATLVVVKDKEDHKTEIKTTEECGVSTNTRIVGGTTADPKAWPWMVALLSNSNKNFFCGGALLNSHYVLTAAHCTFGVANNAIVARLGEYDFRDNGEFHDDYAVVEIKRHGLYSRRTLRNDIALLKLEKTVVFNEFIKTICLPDGGKTYVGEIATLAGWGNLAGNLVGGGTTSNILQEASFPVQSNDECTRVHGISIAPSLICTSSKDGDKGACNGDSGGPLMLLDKNNRWKVIGLVSWGRRGCNPEFPTVYTRVTHFLEWINMHSSL